jgi:hypothetical protein
MAEPSTAIIEVDLLATERRESEPEQHLTGAHPPGVDQVYAPQPEGALSRELTGRTRYRAWGYC